MARRALTPVADEALDLEEEVAQFYDDPEGFVFYAFPWGEAGTPLHDQAGPDEWQLRVLREIGQRVRSGAKAEVAIGATLIAVASGHGVGKALAHGEPVLTPHGWRAIESLRVGDQVIAGDGTATRVRGVFPQGERDLYRVTLDDGCAVVVDGDHQWFTTTRSERKHGKAGGVRTTREIAASLTFANGPRRGLNHELPVVKPVEHPTALLPVEPYLFGCWLGDGDAQGRITGEAPQFERLEAAGAEMGVVGRDARRPNVITRTMLGIRPGLRVLGVYGCRAHEKHIPEVYLRADVRQRTALLQGLLDTDGTVGGNNAVVFETTAPGLADGVAELARSLGGVVRRSERQGGYGGKACRLVYRLYLSLPRDVAPFRLPAKAARYQPRWGDRNCDRTRRRFVASVEKVSTGLATCISVEHPSELFVTKDHIVTHNTALVAWLILWFMSTRPHPQVVVTANTKNQLESKTWRELAKWHKLSVNESWFQWTATKFAQKGNPDTWFAVAIPWTKERAEAFAGTHEKHVLLIFDEACHDDKTEVMTRDGWRLFADLDGSEDLLTMDPATGVSEYRRPTKLFRAPRKGKMIEYRARGASVCVTPNHRMWRRSPDGKGGLTPWKFVEAGALSKAEHHMSRHIDWTAAEQEWFDLPAFEGPRKTWPARRLDMDDWMSFLGWFASEGHFAFNDKPACYSIGITQADAETRREINDLCLRLGFQTFVTTASSTPQIIIQDRGLAEWLLQWGRHSLDKRVPECVRMASPRQQAIFLAAYARGDGYEKGSGRTILYTSSKRLADDLQEVALKAGAISVVRPRHIQGVEAVFRTHVARSSVDGWVVSIQWERTSLVWKHGNATEIDYDGWVYCAEIPPHHLLFTRRDGYCVWSGNSAIDDAIWEVAEGAMTTAGAMWICFGNPTRNTGRFRECWGRFRARWFTVQVDSRTAKMANKAQIQAWLEDYGEDSDFFRVRVKGEFPRAASNQFIGNELVDAAIARYQRAERKKRDVLAARYGERGEELPLVDLEVDDEENAEAPLILGVDVARFGANQTVLLERRGNIAKIVQRLEGKDVTQVAAAVQAYSRERSPDAIMVDGTGVGAGVVDVLRMWGLEVEDCIAGATALNDKAYYNRRIEMWDGMRAWLKKGGMIPDERELRDDLIGPEYGFAGRLGLMQLETKDDMEKRGLASPDAGDALALTFYRPVVKRRSLENKLQGWLRGGLADAGTSWMSH